LASLIFNLPPNLPPATAQNTHSKAKARREGAPQN